MPNGNEADQGSTSSMRKQACIISTVVIVVILVILGINYRFLIRRKVDNTISGNEYPILGDESIMSQKAHGTTDKPVQENLKWNVDRARADQICSFNRHYAEYSGYAWSNDVTWVSEMQSLPEGTEFTYYDSVSGAPLFIAPRGRSMSEFLQESRAHGWPSFRDEEVVWDNVRCLDDGETVSLTGTHLGHDLPDLHGNRYCINLICVAGRPLDTE